MKATTTPPQDFLDRAAKVDVDHVEASFHQSQCTGSKLLGFGAHQLSADWMFVIANVEEVTVFLTWLDFDQEAIKHHLAEGICGAVLAGNYAHGPIAVTRQRGLDNRKTNCNVADMQRLYAVAERIHRTTQSERNRSKLAE